MPGIDFSGDEAARLACIPVTTLDRWLPDDGRAA